MTELGYLDILLSMLLKELCCRFGTCHILLNYEGGTDGGEVVGQEHTDHFHDGLVFGDTGFDHYSVFNIYNRLFNNNIFRIYKLLFQK